MDTILSDPVTLPWIASLAIGLAIMLVTAGLLVTGLGLWPGRRQNAGGRDRRSQTSDAVDDPDGPVRTSRVPSVA